MLSKSISIILLILFIYCAGYANTGRIEVRKETRTDRTPACYNSSLRLGYNSSLRLGVVEGIRRHHPAQSLFPKRAMPAEKTRSDNFERLLVLLVDFQEDNNPRTTGNGKFVLEEDPDYPISLGAPPRDYDYFHHHLVAMQHYYLAASLGYYNLQFDIYPPKGSENFAYTLPNEMAYYNPGMNNVRLFVERVEEYFQDVFRIADESGDIADFGQYGHFMFIHAGSDWQHDVYGDTPNDLPSFFITVGEGKEAVVSDGTVIRSAANVPETISQDDRYGVINAVMAHEFGHSLGFVDLYNVRNSYPGVGYWDIMDSGGATGVLVEGVVDGETAEVAVEGIVPALPSAWHRLLAFGEHYRSQGYFRDIRDYPQDEPVRIAAASSISSRNRQVPYIVKVPVNNNEYILLENRHVDPDGDGGIAIKGAHPITPGDTDYRVALHPIAIDDDDFLAPTYEYDWLLPGWINRRGQSFGGGIIAWHVDEHLIYNEGVTLSDGSFRSNYKNNSVNTNYHNRGIYIIEADNIKDIGNPYSWYWRGTEYEPYYRYKPRLDNEGFFLEWSEAEHNNELSPTSKPPLTSKSGSTSLYSIYNISAVSEIMSFRYRFNPFQSTEVISDNIQPLFIVAPVVSASTLFETVLPVFTEQGIHLFKQLTDDDELMELFHELDFIPTHKPVSLKTDDSPERFLAPAGSILHIIEDEGFSVNFRSIDLLSEITGSPIVRDDNLVIVPTVDNIQLIDFTSEQIINSYPVSSANLAYYQNNLYAVAEGSLYRFDLSRSSVQQTAGLLSGTSPCSSTGAGSAQAQGQAVVQRRTTDRWAVIGTGAVPCPYNLRTNQPRTNQPRTNQPRTGDINYSAIGVIPNFSHEFEPVIVVDTTGNCQKIFIQNEQGDIYVFTESLTDNGSADGEAVSREKIFSLSPYTGKKPTQLAVYQNRTSAGEKTDISLFFAADNYLFSVNTEGTYNKGYPVRFDGKEFGQYTHPRIVDAQGKFFDNNDNRNDYVEDVISLIETTDKGYLAFNISRREIIPGYSWIWERTECNDILYYDGQNSSLNLYFTDAQDNLYMSRFFSDLTDDVIVWNGHRSYGGAAFVGGYEIITEPEDRKITAFAYPNPVKGNKVRVRVTGVNQSVELKLFDISGRLVFDNTYHGITHEKFDARIDISRLSSGIYFGTIRTDNLTAKFNLAVNK